MSQGVNYTQVKKSILYRLLDDEPDKSRDDPVSTNQAIREFKEQVRSDLENLLNSRWRCLGWPEHLKQLKRSLANYGIPDFLGFHKSSLQDQKDLIRSIEEAIELFEPRLRAVHVIVLDKDEEIDRRLRFRIEAVLDVDFIEDTVLYDSTLEPSTGVFQVRGARN